MSTRGLLFQSTSTIYSSSIKQILSSFHQQKPCYPIYLCEIVHFALNNKQSLYETLRHLTFKLLIWMLLFGFDNFGHSSKTVVSNGSIFFNSKLSCSDNILIEQEWVISGHSTIQFNNCIVNIMTSLITEPYNHMKNIYIKKKSHYDFNDYKINL